VLEIRRDFGVGMITAFIRIEGKPFGLIANNPKHLGGAIDAPAGDKAARFMQLCDAFDIPIVSLCDTPGFMVGPEAEKTAIVRHVARMFVTGASLTVPLFGIVLRKGYGLGAQSMIGGGFHASFFTVAWPTGEFGGMGLEGYVRLGFRKEMEAIADPVEREKYYKAKVAELYANGKAVSIASVLEIDEVIDPADTRHWIMAGLRIGAEARAAQQPQAAVHRCVVVLQAILSFGFGGYIAGRARRPLAAGQTDEVENRDGLHGLGVWALGVVLGALLAALVGATTLSRSSPSSANTSAAEPVLSYELDRLYRATRRPPNVDLSAERAEAGRILLTSSSHSGMSAEDRAYLIQQVAASTGLSPPDAERRVDNVIASSKTALTRSRRSTVILAFSLATALLLGAVAAWAAACAGGRHRDGAPLPEWMAHSNRLERRRIVFR
jgi:hypothetical protein